MVRTRLPKQNLFVDKKKIVIQSGGFNLSIFICHFFGLRWFSEQMAPPLGQTECLQLRTVDTHESLPHNVGFQQICPTAEAAFVFF